MSTNIEAIAIRNNTKMTMVFTWYSCAIKFPIIETVITEEIIEEFVDWTVWPINRETNMIITATTTEKPTRPKTLNK